MIDIDNTGTRVCCDATECGEYEWISNRNILDEPDLDASQFTDRYINIESQYMIASKGIHYCLDCSPMTS